MSRTDQSIPDRAAFRGGAAARSRLALLGFSLALLAALALAISGPGHRFGLWDWRTGITILKWAAYGGIGAASVSLLGAVLARPGGGRRGFVFALLGVVIGLAAAAIPWQMKRTAGSVPPIHDITTDSENPPKFKAVLPLRAGAPNPAVYGGADIAIQQLRAYPDIVPAILDLSPAQAFERALATAREMGWTVVEADKAAGRIEATDRTLWFGFVDDVVIRVTPAAAGGSRVDVRSLSRVGRSDLGTNAKRIRAFLARLKGG